MAKKILSAEDSALFRQTIGKVNEIKSDTLILSPKEKPKPYPKEQSSEIKSDFTDTVDPSSALERLSHEDSISFIAPGLQKNVLKKLRKGFFGLDATLDLHGLTSQEAKKQLSHFLHFSVEDGYRCVHIIHGKGYRSSNNHPVLKNDINVWLRQHNKVQAFCSAPTKEGGTGAVFVLLKLSKKYSDEEDTQY
ncbi:MAG: Smr/MutS family protein [Methylococcales bacterium]|nr:Smr/MutS family protein [Methylococcales bacterium]